MLSALTLELAEPFKIVVENRLDTISPYILLEQETWFESEVPLFRALLQPGMRMVDIGANCGFYTLLGAQRVGQEGHVWAFEPGLKPARLLKESLRLNGFANVTLFEAAAGLEPGTTWFLDNEMSEVSAVAPSDAPGAREVRVESLDDLYAQGQLRRADMVKIDAEGFEEQVIRGGRAYFDAEDPLVMLEVTSGEAAPDLGPASLLQEQGYQPYRYNAAIGCLAPLVTDRIGDFLLNIFLCKPGRAASLREAGLLVTGEDLEREYAPAQLHLFTSYFLGLPIVRSCPWLGFRVEAMQQPTAAGYGSMCAEFLMSEDPNLSAAERLVRLRRAEAWIDTQFRSDMPPAMILSLTRVLAACGRITVIAGLLDMVAGGKPVGPDTLTYPFLPVSQRWAKAPPLKGDFTSWLIAMIADNREVLRTPSSLYDSKGTRVAYETVRKSGYLDEALERRAALCALTMETAAFPEPRFIMGQMPRNRAIWNEIAARLAQGETKVTSLELGRELPPT